VCSVLLVNPRVLLQTDEHTHTHTNTHTHTYMHSTDPHTPHHIQHRASVVCVPHVMHSIPHLCLFVGSKVAHHAAFPLHSCHAFYTAPLSVRRLQGGTARSMSSWNHDSPPQSAASESLMGLHHSQKHTNLSLTGGCGCGCGCGWKCGVGGWVGATKQAASESLMGLHRSQKHADLSLTSVCVCVCVFVCGCGRKFGVGGWVGATKQAASKSL
jgi:hypothetical protein